MGRRGGMKSEDLPAAHFEEQVRLVLTSVQLGWARQNEKEQRASEDGGRRSDDSYSPRRHWCSN